MAVGADQWFNYETTLILDADGVLHGSVINRQAQQGAVPGLAGLNPTVTVLGDTLLIESNSAEAPPHAAWDWITLLIPFAHNAYVTRRLRAAQVRSFELVLPGLTKRLKPGYVMKLIQCYVPLPGNPFSVKRHCEVVLLEEEAEIYRWISPNFDSTDW
jgi:hypothetical protein